MLLTKKNMDALNLSTLTKEQTTKLMEIKDNLKLSNDGIFEYGTEISENLGNFSTELLNKVKLKDNPEIETLLESLMDEINSIDAEKLSIKKKGFLSKLFHTNEVEKFIRKHDTVVSAVEATKQKLEQCQYQLRKDIATAEEYYKENAKNIEDLDYHIVAGRLKIQEERQKYAELAKTTDNDDMLAVQELANYQGYIDLLDKKIYNLELLRGLAIQNIPKLKILSDGDNATIEKINTSITMTIPVWESQMLLAILISRAATATRLDKAVTDMTNRLIEENSSYLKMTATEIATQIERGVIDINSLKKSGNDIVDTCKEIKQIRANAQKEREAALVELKQIQTNLASTILTIEQKQS